MGRNLLLQQIERLLVLSLSHQAGGAPPADFKERQQKQADTINKTMLGHLVDRYGTEVLQDAGVEVPEEEGPADWVTFSFRISADAKFVEAMRRDMKLMTDQRNGAYPWLPAKMAA
ncbi:MAG: hypothetical protein IPG33_10050 [Betaproteobacteria bacterium]|nr:hypothetical protein [Betaproteobacteria bacterium]